MVDDQMIELDSIVVSLPIKLKAAIRAFYVGRGTVAQKSRDCGCAPETMYRRIHSAHIEIANRLRDNRRQRSRELHEQ